MTRCPACGDSAPQEAYFCIRCGAVLRPAARGPAVRPIGTTGPTVRLRRAADAPAPSAPPSSPAPPARRPFREAAGPLVGLLFSVVFLIGFAQFLASGGLRGFGPWMVGLVTTGALLAEQAWVNGDRWGGMRGMLIWGGLAWLLAVDRAIPWAGALILVWYALQPRWFGRRPYR